MRPPKQGEEGVVLVLDTQPECQVLLCALDARKSLFAVSDTNSADSIYATRMRFEEQTRCYPPTIPPGAREYGPAAYEDLIWKERLEFKIEPQDIEVVMLAAQRVLDERRFSVKISNRLAGRTKAAKAIVKALDDAIFYSDR